MKNFKTSNENIKRNNSKIRTLSAVFFSIIAALALFPMIISIWANLVLLDANNFASTTTTILVNPKVSNKIATSLSDTIINGDTINDIAQSVLTPEEINQPPDQVKAKLKEIFNQNIVQIINTPAIQNNTSNILKTIHTQLIETPTPGATTTTINLRPIITSIIDSTKGTKIAIVSTKFTLEDGKGIVTLNADQYKKIENVVHNITNAMWLLITVYILSLALAIFSANNRKRTSRRLLITFGVILLIFGLPILLIPLILSGSANSNVAAIMSGAGITFNPLSISMLIAGTISVACGIYLTIKSKKDSKPQNI